MSGKRFPYQGTIRLLHAFQEQQELPTRECALKAVLFINQAMVNDYRSGMKYAVSDCAQSRLELAELYRSHAEMINERPLRRGTYLPLSGIDDMAMADIRNYFEDNSVGILRPHYRALTDPEIVTTAISMAGAMCDHFGKAEDGGLHIPVAYPGDLDALKQRHIHFKLD